MNQDTKTVYTLGDTERFVDQVEDIYDLVIEDYWGTLIDVPDGVLDITVDMTRMEASVRNTHNGITIEYNILAFDRREP